MQVLEESHAERHEVSELISVGGKFRDLRFGHECHKIWHPTKLTRYTVWVNYTVYMIALCVCVMYTHVCVASCDCHVTIKPRPSLLQDRDNQYNIIHMIDYFYFRNHLCITFELMGWVGAIHVHVLYMYALCMYTYCKSSFRLGRGQFEWGETNLSGITSQTCDVLFGKHTYIVPVIHCSLFNTFFCLNSLFTG